MITLADPKLKAHTFDTLPVLAVLREGLFLAPVEICIERARLITEYMRSRPESEMTATPLLFRAKAVAHYLEHREPVFPDDNLLAGSTGSKRKSAPVYPEFIGQTIWSELDTISRRPKNPQLLSKKDAETLNLFVYPHWIDRDVLAQATNEHGDITPLRLLTKAIFFIASKAGCISHTVPMFERVLAEGLERLIAEANEKANGGGDSVEFYHSVAVALGGLVTYARHLAEAARARASTESDSARRAHYEALAEVCEQVPGKPARNFREAVNSVWLCLVGIHAENINMAISPGRLDQVLYPYYARDRENARITEAEAIELVGNLWLKLGDNVDVVPQVSEELFGGAGTAPAVTVGGVDKDGEDAVNDLTYIMLRATELLKLREPNMNARFHPEKNDRRYRDRVAEVIASTKAVPAFHNDVANVQTLVNQGTALEHARDYAIIGCVELAAAGRSYDASSSIIMNLSAPLEMALYNGQRYSTGEERFGPETGDASQFTDYAQFRKAFYTQLDWLIAQAIDLNEKFAAIHQQMLPTPLLSALFDGPMEKGKDLIFGGALYNSSGATHVGFADVVDSLNAVKAVLSDGRYSMKTLVDAVRADFQDYPDLQQFVLNKAMKYGTSDESANGESRHLVKHLYDTYQNYTNYRGGPYRPAYWSMTNHAGQGKITHALPNGRKAGEPFASGITPVSGAARELTQCLNSVAALGANHIPGNVALNIKFTVLETDHDVASLGDYVEGYFLKGGQQVQFNIMSRDMLRMAKANPMMQPDLLVRVSGYSAYFKDLSDKMKDELISRTEYDVHNGKAVT